MADSSNGSTTTPGIDVLGSVLEDVLPAMDHDHRWSLFVMGLKRPLPGEMTVEGYTGTFAQVEE